eukprot:7122467-Lingulodinium_polyedra.AAC.1
MLGYKTPAHATVDASCLNPCAIDCRRRVRAKPSLLNVLDLPDTMPGHLPLTRWGTSPCNRISG